MTNDYQSNGACSQSCAGYAFAVVQNKNCWCSNYIPADTASTGSCSVPCPGYPYESCGDESSGLFGYVALGKAPLGTQGAVASNVPTEASSASQPTQATQSTAQAVSTLSLHKTSSGSLSPSPLGDSSFPSTTLMLRPSLPFSGFSTSFSSTPISLKTHILTQIVQNTSPDPSLVTVQDTVTASQPVQTSYVSIVCSYLDLFSQQPQYFLSSGFGMDAKDQLANA